MTLTLTQDRIDGLLTLTGQYLQIDGYYIRHNEINLRGSLLTTETDWQERFKAELKALGYTLRARQNGTTVYADIYPISGRIPWLNIVLFLTTVVTVSFIPASIVERGKIFVLDIDLARKWLPFSGPLLLILLSHEFGHYLAARRRGIRASLPYFIPSPNILGTFGAFIKMKSAMPRRRDLLEVGAAGPIAGFIVAIIFLIISLSNLTYRPLAPELATGNLFEPLIVRIIFFFLQTNPVPEGHYIILMDNQMFYAAWVGIVLTMFNLLPVGQLDGGHIIYALFPGKHRKVSLAVVGIMLGFGFFWAGWWLWGILVYIMMRFRHPPTLNDGEPLDSKSRLLAWITIIVFILSFTPIPL